MNELQNNQVEIRDPPRRMGRTRRDEPTRELVRFAWLIAQLERAGIGQAEIAARTGVKMSYLNQIRNYERYGNKGIGAEIVRFVMKGLGIDPAYFFSDYEGEQDFRLYLLSAKRDEKRVAALETGLAEAQRFEAAQAVELARLKELYLQQSQDMALLRAELRKLLGERTARRTKRTAS